MAGSREDAAHRRQRQQSTRQLLTRMSSATGGERRRVENHLITVNVPVARDVARRYHGRGLASDDIDQVAYLGLVKAVRGYDPARATDFLGYAVPTIRGEVRRHFRDQGWTVRPPRSVQELQPRLRHARADLWQRLGREPRPGEIAVELGLDEARVDEALSSAGCFTPSSLDVAEDEGRPVSDRLGALDPGFAQADARATLLPALRGLTERERRILTMRFRDGRTQAEIGSEIGVTQMQVSRLLSGLFARLRAEMTGLTGHEPAA